jgi:ABC-2 type transport system permease protein
MRGFIAFTKKEFMEQIRTYKVLIMVSLLFVIGMMSPLLAKLMPEIMAGIKMEGVSFHMPDAVVSDAYAQFFKYITQMGIIAVLLVFGGTLSNELTKGTLVNMLAKGLPRHTVILSKYFAAVILWTICYLISVVTNYGYSVFLFEDTTVPNLFLSLLCMWLFVCFVIALILLSSAVTEGGFGGLILTVIIIFLMMLLNMVPSVKEYNPIRLASVNSNLIIGDMSSSDVIKSIWITIILTVSSLFASIKLFGKKKL